MNGITPQQVISNGVNKLKRKHDLDLILQKQSDTNTITNTSLNYSRVNLVSPDPERNIITQNGNGVQSDELSIDVKEDSNSVQIIDGNLQSPDIIDNTPAVDIPDEILCTACNKKIKWKKKKVCKHPRLGVILCKSCLKFVNSNDFATDEQGIEEFCTWCGDGGNLVCCDFCEKAFCKHCIKRNLGKPFLKTLLEATDDVKWKCFCCDINQITVFVSQCTIIMNQIDKMKFEDSSFDVKKTHIHGPSKKERLQRLNEISETVATMPESHVPMKSSFVHNEVKDEAKDEKESIRVEKKVDDERRKEKEKTREKSKEKQREQPKIKEEDNISKKKKPMTLVLSSSDDSDEEIVLISKSGKKTVLNKSILMAAQELLNKQGESRKDQSKKKEKEYSKKTSKSSEKPNKESNKKGLSSFMRLNFAANTNDSSQSGSDSESPPERPSTSSDSSDNETIHEKKKKSKSKGKPEIVDGVVVDDEQPGPSGVKPKKKQKRTKSRKKKSDSTDDEDFIPNYDALHEIRKEEAKKIMTNKMLGSDEVVSEKVTSPKAKRSTMTSERAGEESLEFQEAHKKRDQKESDSNKSNEIDEGESESSKGNAKEKVDGGTEKMNIDNVSKEGQNEIIGNKTVDQEINETQENDKTKGKENDLNDSPGKEIDLNDSPGKENDINDSPNNMDIDKNSPENNSETDASSTLMSPLKLSELSENKLNCSVNVQKLDINLSDSAKDSSNTTEENESVSKEDSPNPINETESQEKEIGVEETADVQNQEDENHTDSDEVEGANEQIEGENGEDKGENGDDDDDKNQNTDSSMDSDEESNNLRRSKRKREAEKQSTAGDSSDEQVVVSKPSKKKRRKQKRHVASDDEEHSESDFETTKKKAKPKKQVSVDVSSDSDDSVKDVTNRKTRSSRRKKSVSESLEELSSDTDSSVVEHDTISSGSSESSDASIIITRKKKTGKNTKKKGRGKNKKKKSDEEESDDDDNKKTPTKGRKKIRKIMKDDQLTEETRHARELEEQRRQRLLKRTAKDREEYRKVLEVCDGEYILERNNKKEPLVSVAASINYHLKPHQRKGIQFMYDCCIESISSYRKGEEGGGCLLAHCMGLGKTLQIVSFVHTLANNENIKMERFLVVAPLNTVLNWEQEFQKWLKVEQRIDVYVLSNCTNGNKERMKMIREWHENGGALITGYEMYRNLVNFTYIRSKKMKEDIKRCLVDPGPELVVCDEGHVLRNNTSAISIAMNAIKTRRRVVLTGTPLQNNLPEYHVMVNFVKPNLLGTKKEFQNRFVNPINNGRCSNSTPRDVRIMKQRCHVLYQLLSGCVQRQDYSVLTPFLPSKREYTIFVRLTEKQKKIYEYYLENFVYQGPMNKLKGNSLFSDFHCLSRIWCHPWSLHLERLRRIAREQYKDDSMDEFIDDEGDEESSASEDDGKKPWNADTSSDEDDKKRRKRRKEFDSSSSSEDEDADDSGKESSAPTMAPRTRSTRTSRAAALKEDRTDVEESSNDTGDQDVKKHILRGSLRSGINFKDGALNPEKPEEEPPEFNDWYDQFLTPEDESNVELSGKLVIMLEVIANAEVVGDKVLVFTQSLASLDLIEAALGGGTIGGNQLNWCHGIDYYRMDGSTSVQKRKRWADHFNDPDNEKCRLFLISTKAGSLGINMVGANRVIIFDCSWNPSHDVQSVFRVYRFGQDKPVYVYRLVAQGTMEEKVYDRQITKLAVASRVVDEMQIERHFTDEEIRELYTFTPEKIPENPETPQLPKDPLLAEVLQRQHPTHIVRYHEHDLLLENVEEEEMTEEEKKQAWKNYEDEKSMSTRTFTYRPANALPELASINNFQTLYNQQQQQVNSRLQQVRYQLMSNTSNVVSVGQSASGQVTYNILPPEGTTYDQRLMHFLERKREIERLAREAGAGMSNVRTVLVNTSNNPSTQRLQYPSFPSAASTVNYHQQAPPNRTISHQATIPVQMSTNQGQPVQKQYYIHPPTSTFAVKRSNETNPTNK